MSLATESKSTTAPSTVKAGKPTPAQIKAYESALAKTAADIRTRYALADVAETEAIDAWKAAGIAKDNARIIKARVVYAAATLVLFNGEPNLAGAVKVIHSKEYGVDKFTKTQVNNLKNTLRPYLAYGKALAAAGMIERVTEPAQDERDVIEAYLAAVAEQKAKDDADAARKAKQAGKGDSDDDSDDDDDAPAGGRVTDPSAPVTQDDVIAAVEALQSIVAAFTRDHGFSATVADNLTDTLGEISTQIDSFKVDGGDS